MGILNRESRNLQQTFMVIHLQLPSVDDLDLEEDCGDGDAVEDRIRDEEKNES